MPIYTIECVNRHRTEQFMTVAMFEDMKRSLNMRCGCGEMGQVVIHAPMMVKAAPDICYDSPIDGRPITSWDARQEDLKRNHCRPYDPEMKKDAERFRKEQDEKLDQAIEGHVEEAIEKMPTGKRGKLYSELTEQGTGIEYVRSTVQP